MKPFGSLEIGEFFSVPVDGREVRFRKISATLGRTLIRGIVFSFNSTDLVRAY